MQDIQELDIPRHESVRDSVERLERLAHAWDGLLENVNAIRVISMEYAFRFLEGEVVLTRLKNERLRKLLVNLLKSNPERLPNPPELRIIRILLSEEVARGYNDRIAPLVTSGMGLLGRGVYVGALLEDLEGFIVSTDAFDARFYSILRELAIAFLLKGFNPSRIRSLVTDVFFEHTRAYDGLTVSTFPFEVITPGLPPLDVGSAESIALYSSEITSRLQLLTLHERFVAMLRYYQQEARDLTYVFPVKGIKGRQTHTIGRIELYSPFTGARCDRGAEVFGRSATDSLNAAIMLRSLGSEEDRSRAAQLIQNELDLIAFYVPMNVPLEVDTSNCTTIRPDGSLFGGASRTDRFDPATEHQYLARDMDELATHPDSMATLLSATASLRELPATSDVRIYEALHAISKSGTDGVLEDRLVNAWIAMEALMGAHGDKEGLAMELIPALAVTNMRWTTALRLFRYLEHSYSNYRFHGSRGIFDNVTDDLVRRSFVIREPWGSFDLRDFVMTLDEWLTAIPSETECYRRLLGTREFYRNARTATNELRHHSQAAAEDLILVYQVRNRIVHHAFLESPGMKYLVERAEGFARLLMRTVLARPNMPFASIAADEIVRAKRLLQHVEHDPSFDLLSAEL